VGNFDDFLGRVGTVDYILITTPARIDRLCARIQERFARAMDPPNSTSKPITAHLTLSFGVVADTDGPFGDIRSLSLAVSHAKTMA
jgi:hypothetical protein